MKNKFLILLPWLFLGTNPQAQTQFPATYSDSVLKHVYVLASDSLEGRETGTPGEKKSGDYISRQLKKGGLTPMGDKGTWFQPFPFSNGIKFGNNCSFALNGETKKIEKEYYPLPSSSNGFARGLMVFGGYGIIAPDQNHNDYQDLKDLKDKILILETSTPDKLGPHSAFSAWDLKTRVDSAASRGAAGVIFINSDSTLDQPAWQGTHVKLNPSSIPVVFVKDAQMVMKAKDSGFAILYTEIYKDEREGRNVIGFVDKKAPLTVVIGAHYDHLGMGHEGSLHRGEPGIHNGADDNASGTSALIELGKFLAKTKDPQYAGNNYLIMAFSGEEKGLFGSAFFTKNPTYPLEKINYMINMDMVGRLNAERKLIINGAGTSPAWQPVLEKMNVDSIIVKTSESGVGPSDHTSFYLKDIPSLHFFTGTHTEYHKPSDDKEKLNYAGMVSVMNCILHTIQSVNGNGELAFTKTKDENNENTPRFKVTLGVVPDYMFEGSGMRIDGVSDGKPASKAGMLAGDVVIAIGSNEVKDMNSYMKALSMFKKGDEAVVKFKRGEDTLEKTITF